MCTGLFKQQGLVFFEGAWQGQKRKCLVEEAELPMISGTSALHNSNPTPTLQATSLTRLI